LSDATTPSVLELNDLAAAQKNRKTSSETNKKILFTEFGYRNSDQAAKEPWTEKTQLITRRKSIYESLFQTLTQKNGLREDLPGNGMPMIITNAKKSVDYTPQEKPALETIKDGTDNLK
jgi:hypothetical protein